MRKADEARYMAAVTIAHLENERVVPQLTDREGFGGPGMDTDDSNLGDGLGRSLQRLDRQVDANGTVADGVRRQRHGRRIRSSHRSLNAPTLPACSSIALIGFSRPRSIVSAP